MSRFSQGHADPVRVGTHSPDPPLLAGARQSRRGCRASACLAAMLATTRDRREQIIGALRRLKDGSYGRCEKCDTPIPAERLEVLPHARFCVPCQRKHIS